jgi:fusaric acid resistance family protein
MMASLNRVDCNRASLRESWLDLLARQGCLLNRKIVDLMVARAARMKRKAPLAETFRWSTKTEVELAPRFYLAGPVLAGAVTGHPTFGLVASAGSLMVASALLVWPPPVWGVTMLVGLVGVGRPLLRARNYLLYSLVMTPLILLMLDAGRAPDLGVLFDRVLATLIGSGLVLSAGMVVSHLTAKPDAR